MMWKGEKITSLFNNKTTAGLIGYVHDGELSKVGIKSVQCFEYLQRNGCKGSGGGAICICDSILKKYFQH